MKRRLLHSPGFWIIAALAALILSMAVDWYNGRLVPIEFNWPPR